MNGNVAHGCWCRAELADHHFGNRAASTRIEDLMEHMSINVEWKSNFQKLAEPQNQELQTAFRKGKMSRIEQSKEPRLRRRDDWNGKLRIFNATIARFIANAVYNE